MSECQVATLKPVSLILRELPLNFPPMTQTNDTDRLAQFFADHQRVAVLTGAGCSSASGIPEYRDDAGNWKHAQPVQFSDFVNSAAMRRRYWARSFSGWQRIAAARPNAAHTALADLDTTGRIAGLVTQNVDNLHRRAGSRNVIDLHGVLERVRCLSCDQLSPRADYQQRLHAANPDWTATTGSVRPDGDVELHGAAEKTFRVPDCGSCGGLLKPDVVFFGESVPRQRVGAARDLVGNSDALLVVGSSLMVFSGFRFVRQARDAGIPVAILNRGVTRADDLADLRLNHDCGALLAACAARLGTERTPAPARGS